MTRRMNPYRNVVLTSYISISYGFRKFVTHCVDANVRLLVVVTSLLSLKFIMKILFSKDDAKVT